MVSAAEWVALPRGAGDAGKNHVPTAAPPTPEGAVAGIPLLLGAGVDLPGDLGVGNESAARKVAAGIRQFYWVVDEHTPDGSSLRNAPLQSAPPRGGHFHVLHRTPEVLRVIPIDRLIRLQVPLVNVDGVGGLAEAGNRFIEPHRGFDAGVGARLEKHRIAVCAELRVAGQRCEGRIDRRHRIAGRKDVDVGAKDRIVLCEG